MRSFSRRGAWPLLLLCVSLAGCGGYGPESDGSFQQVTKAREKAEAGLKGAGAKMELKNGMSAELKKMAQKSIDDQQKDIKVFQQWLSSHK